MPWVSTTQSPAWKPAVAGGPLTVLTPPAYALAAVAPGRVAVMRLETTMGVFVVTPVSRLTSWLRSFAPSVVLVVTAYRPTRLPGQLRPSRRSRAAQWAAVGAPVAPRTVARSCAR